MDEQNRTDQFDEPLSEAEKREIAVMPSHEVYLLTKMIPHGTVRAREVNEIYHLILQHDFSSSSHA